MTLIEVSWKNGIWLTMPATIVVGAQWGDEGKGKIVDYLAGQAKAIARYNGGANSGHTVLTNGKVYKLHLIPSGALHKNKVLILGNGMVIDPEVLVEEIKLIKKENPKAKICISERAHVVMPYHKVFDAGRDTKLKGKKIGTTGRGIGPTYEDKMDRSEALRICDITNNNLSEKIAWVLKQKSSRLSEFGLKSNGSYFEEIYKRTARAGKFIKEYVCDTSFVANSLLDAGESILLEGAQGTLLDIDHGTFPYVSSSNGTAGGACTGVGISPTKVKSVFGVAKAYVTRVGEGPFPTELLDEVGERIRITGAEYGTTTGRPRRVGWLDLSMLAYSHRINNFTSLAITKLDILTGIHPIKVCVGYEKKGKNGQLFTSNIQELAELKPVYQKFDGWDSFPSRAQIRREGRRALPKNSRKYLKFIEDYLSVPIKIISYGPDRKETISS